ncbi:MAG: RibD family protein [Acidimicrobiia bacterium]
MAVPTVTVHYAQSLDGRIATRTGDSRWLSSDGSLQLAHELRAANDAVMVGVGTVIADDPQLTVRHVAGNSPLRVVADSTLRLPLGALLVTEDPSLTLIATTRRASPDVAARLDSLGVEISVLPDTLTGRVDLPELLAALGERGIASVLVEGGRELITSFLREGLADRLVVCIAPRIIGAGVDAVGDLGVGMLSEAITFKSVDIKQIDGDVIVDGQLEPSPARTQ